MGKAKTVEESPEAQAEDEILVQDEEDDLLGSARQDGDPVNFWEKKQREVVTSVVDYNLGTLADLVRSKTIDLSPRYQRRFRWDEKRQSRLIESFLMNVPVPPVFLNEDEYGKYSVIDGKQRLQAISSLFTGKLRLTGLEVFSDINEKTYDDLPEELKTVLRVRPTVRAIIILRQSDVDVKFEVFKRLNTGGVKLNAQEIRNSTYTGPLNDLVLKLKSIHDSIRSWESEARQSPGCIRKCAMRNSFSDSLRFAKVGRISRAASCGKWTTLWHKSHRLKRWI